MSGQVPMAKPAVVSVFRPLDVPLAGFIADRDYDEAHGHRVWVETRTDGFPRPYARLAQKDGVLLAPFTVALPSRGHLDSVGLALSFDGPAAARALAAALLAICDEIGDDAPGDIPF